MWVGYIYYWWMRNGVPGVYPIVQRETKETRGEIGALKQNLQALQKTQSLESTSYQSNEESPSDKEVHQTANPRTDTIQEPSRSLF